MVSDAIFSLAKQRRGAIFVFPGNDSLKPWSSEGTSLDAEPSYPLLMSIFDPHSPGHDGAAIIENGRVASFSVRLPLSESGKLSDEYGTRHHAGLGLSEVTDARVIVVSEERGTVTLFSEGTVEPIQAPHLMAAKILNHWEHSTSFHLFNQGDKKQKKIITPIVISFMSVVQKIEKRRKSSGLPVTSNSQLSAEMD